MTVMLPKVIAPTQTPPETKSPRTEAGILPIITVGTPGPVIGSPVTVISPTRAAGNISYSPFLCHYFAVYFELYQNHINLTSGFSELFLHHFPGSVPCVCMGQVCISPTLAAGGICVL
jgi:hypothetical protein